MSIDLIIPVIDQHELTRECLDFIEVNSPSVTRTVFDNASDASYLNWHPTPTGGTSFFYINRREKNLGFYKPLQEISRFSTSLFIGLLHNDLFIYEEGWDKRVEAAFEADPKLMLIGFCGSDQVDERGGRGTGTMSNFAGIRGQLQIHTGRQITDLRPALILDSLAMIFRREAIPLLGIDDNIVPCHFYDKIWCLKLIDQGFHVGVMGVLCDHIGGQTSVGVARYNKDAEEWCDAHRLPFNQSNPADAAHQIYLEAERRMFAEFGPKGLIPSRVDQDYTVHRNIGQPKYPNGFRLLSN